MRVEPKTFFANERTFLTWLHMAVTIGTIAAALLGFSGSAQRSKEPAYDVNPLLPACYTGHGAMLCEEDCIMAEPPVC